MVHVYYLHDSFYAVSQYHTSSDTKKKDFDQSCLGRQAEKKSVLGRRKEEFVCRGLKLQQDQTFAASESYLALIQPCLLYVTKKNPTYFSDFCVNNRKLEMLISILILFLGSGNLAGKRLLFGFPESFPVFSNTGWTINNTQRVHAAIQYFDTNVFMLKLKPVAGMQRNGKKNPLNF